jgi:hypothetical protein
MRPAHDIHAETNPAYCAAVLAQFCEAHNEHQGKTPALASIYLVLPIALSEDLANTFEKCVKSTGLLVWLDRSPGVRAELSGRVNATLAVTTEAIRFGCLTGLLRLNSDGTLASSHRKLPAVVSSGVAAITLKRARLLGAWFAEVGSARAVMEAMGVSV